MDILSCILWHYVPQKWNKYFTLTDTNLGGFSLWINSFIKESVITFFTRPTIYVWTSPFFSSNSSTFSSGTFRGGGLSKNTTLKQVLLYQCLNGFPSQKTTNREQPEVRNPETAPEYKADLFLYDKDTFYYISCANLHTWLLTQQLIWNNEETLNSPGKDAPTWNVVMEKWKERCKIMGKCVRRRHPRQV